MVGKALKYMRKKRNYSQQELSKILNINQTTLSGWEREYRTPTFENVEKIANICNFKIIFKDKNESFEIENLKRKDV